ncbi:hypothetical protein N658DRAFT_498300 [Parathielavia hyrcaniae]|uniref:Uncharacterized protein n=1 Tax=Parathielavia hyrcaniae TaxID=113614 RepID=A0AAN6PXH1_9PEZI|nr:hypothetical protein N658DRAFT_498300 [Parathielavia hyrcaniae]
MDGCPDSALPLIVCPHSSSAFRDELKLANIPPPSSRPTLPLRPSPQCPRTLIIIETAATMIPSVEHPVRGRRRAGDNDTLYDDGYISWSDDESISSRSTVSFDYFPVRERQYRAPIFRLKREESPGKPVYEAWNIEYYPRKRVPVLGFKLLGVRLEDYDDVEDRFVVSPQPSVQPELANMHLQALEAFQSKHKRCWATRALRGRGKTYEQDLEERCRALPDTVQTALTQLLMDRGGATSTHYRTRTWTVVVMREQLRKRFTDTDLSEVKRHKLRKWKNPGPEETMVYTVLIRGAETKACPDDAGFSTFAPLYNPWVHSDRTEGLSKQREQRRQRETLRCKRHQFSPPYGNRSPPYRNRSASFRTRLRSASPPSYQNGRSRFDSPPPPLRRSRFESPPPYRRFARSESPTRSRSPSVRIRVVPRRNTCYFDDVPLPPSPTPPGSFTPPPGVSAYNRPAMAPPAPFPGPFANPFHSPPPFPGSPNTAPGGHRNPFNNPHHTAAPFRPTPPSCIACRASRTCGHFLAYPCTRPLLWNNGITHHPPCVICARIDAASRAPFLRAIPPHADTGAHHHHPLSAPYTHVGAAPLFTQPYPFRPRSPCVEFSPHPHPPPPPLAAAAARPPSWVSQSSSVGPVPPAPNPFSPLSTPPLTSAGGSSPVLSSTSTRARTPTAEEEEEVVAVAVGGEPEVRRAGSPAPSGVGSHLF